MNKIEQKFFVHWSNFRALTFKRQSMLAQLGVLIFFLIIAFIINRFSKGTSIAGGDFYQLIDPLNHWQRYFYGWLNQIGQGSFNTLFSAAPFYALIAFLSYLKIGSNILSSFYIFFILYLSYLSFFYSIRLIFPKINYLTTLGASLVYALNNFTVTIFTYPWGFTHHFFIYIFIPPLFSLFYSVLVNNKRVHFYYLALVLVASTIAFNNLAFLASVLLLQGLLAAGLLISGQVKINLDFFKKCLSVAGVYLVTLGLLVFIWVISMKDSLGSVTNSAALGGDGLKTWLKITSSDFINSFSLALDKTRYPVADSAFYLFLSLVYFGVILFLVYYVIKYKDRFKEQTKDYRLVAIFSALLLILLALSVRAYGPFENISLILYRLPFFNLFRSPEKIFVLIPFVYLLVLIGFLNILKMSKIKVTLIFIALLLIPLPFYNGMIKKSLGENAGVYQYVTAIPNEYREAAGLINGDKKSTSVISLPFSVINSINWSNYPKWGFIGHDILHLLFNKFYISANTYDHPMQEKKPSFAAYNESPKVDVDLFLLLVQKFGGEYIIMHKDIDNRWLKRTKLINLTLDQLVKRSIAEKVVDNQYFSLYKIAENKIMPIITANEAKITFRKINPSYYRLSVKNLRESDQIKFRQSFNSKWKFYLLPDQNKLNCDQTYTYTLGNATECYAKNSLKDFRPYLMGKNVPVGKHALIDDYANMWQIDSKSIEQLSGKNYYKVNPDGSVDFEAAVYFEPQSYLDIYFISLPLIVIIGWFLIKSKKRKNDTKILN